MTDSDHRREINAATEKLNKAIDAARYDGLVVGIKMTNYSSGGDNAYLRGQPFLLDCPIVRPI